MNATEAINSIVNLLGLQFKKETFVSVLLVDGETQVTNNLDNDFDTGQTLYIVSDSTLKPAPPGEHETQEGKLITVDEESTIIAIAEKGAESEEEKEVAEEEMTQAKSYDGDILESKTFDVGEEIYQVLEDGSKEPAKDGEYEITLKDSKDNEVKIRLIVKDGKIEQRDNVEEMSEKKMDSDFAQDIADIKQSIQQLLEVVDSLNGKFKTEVNSLKTDFESFKNSPERKPIDEKKTYSESFGDYKLDLIKSMRHLSR